MLSTPPLKRAQMKDKAKNVQLSPNGGLMPKAKPVSLHPLTFEQVIDVLIKSPPKPLKKRAKSKPKQRKKSL